MAYKQLFVAIGMIVAATPLSATQSDPAPAIAPPGDANTRYCLRIEAVTGSRLEEVKCWTRAEWAEQDVDVDKEWPKEGVKVIA